MNSLFLSLVAGGRLAWLPILDILCNTNSFLEKYSKRISTGSIHFMRTTGDNNDTANRKDENKQSGDSALPVNIESVNHEFETIKIDSSANDTLLSKSPNTQADNPIGLTIRRGIPGIF